MQVQNMIVTPWQTETPALFADVGWGTLNASSRVRTRRNGGSLECRFTIKAGTVTGGSAILFYIFNGASVSSNTTLNTAGLSMIGQWYSDADKWGFIQQQNGGGVTGCALTISTAVYSGTIAAVSPTFANAAVVSGMFSLQIAGWS